MRSKLNRSEILTCCLPKSNTCHFTGSQSFVDYYNDYDSIKSGYGGSCEGTEATLSECVLPDFDYGNCYEFAKVHCLVEQEPGTEGELRLANNYTEGNIAYGQMELYKDGAWGRVCTLGSNTAASVACRSLGYHDKGEIRRRID